MVLPINANLGYASIISCFADSIVLHRVECCHESDVAEAANAPYIEPVIDAAFSKECVN